MDIKTVTLDNHTIEIELRTVHPGYPANRRGHPDTWTPEEGAEREAVGAWLVRGERRRALNPRKTMAHLDRHCDGWEA